VKKSEISPSLSASHKKNVRTLVFNENARPHTSEHITQTIKNLDEECCCNHPTFLVSPSDFYWSGPLVENQQGYYYITEEALQNAVCQ
jgi:hypothetical protein